MNRHYSLVWNCALRVLQVASELATTRGGGTSGGCGFLRRRTVAAACALILGFALVTPAFAQQATSEGSSSGASAWPYGVPNPYGRLTISYDPLTNTLTIDPQTLITLGEEAALQRLYLDIQKVRFPTRLNVVFEIAPEVEDARVPNLILQPLVENSIKHAVAQSTAPVTLRVCAVADGQTLRITVEDDGGNSANGSEPVGSSIGLANVAERLRAHFGQDGILSSGPSGEGGFRNAMQMPLRRRS